MRSLDHVDRAAVGTGVSLLAGRRQRPGQILVTAPALHPKRTGPTAGFGAWRVRFRVHFHRQLELADFVRWDLAIGLFAFNVLRFGHGSLLVAPLLVNSNRRMDRR